MSPEVLRLTVAILAVLVVGSALTVAGRYLRAATRLGRSPGRILARHVVEVATGSAGLALGYAIAVLDQLGGTVLVSATGRLWLYLVSMVLLLVGVLEVGRYQRTRAQRHTARQAQVRDGIRAAIDRQRVTGPASADRAAVLAANAVLNLEGTPTLPVPEQPASGPHSSAPDPGHGRHALRKDRRAPR